MPQHAPADRPHKRRNLLTGEAVLVSPHRTQRPWSGLEEEPDHSALPRYDGNCYLCPGNVRANGTANPQYSSTFVFTNDFSALKQESIDIPAVGDDLLITEPERGICRVICYSPRHDRAMATMTVEEVGGVVETWQREYAQLGATDDISYVQIFENRGLMMGCSNPHPHGQVWATSGIPTIPMLEDHHQKQFMHRRSGCLLCAYLEREMAEKSRILFVNDSFVALVPFWAVWPFETMVLPRFHAPSIDSLTWYQREDLARLLIQLTICYDNLFATSFPYSMGIHQQPTDGGDHEHHHWHMHFIPPLLRSRSVRKHMVGFELMAMPQRDLTPEAAAEKLRGLSTVHYTRREGDA